MTHVDAFIEKRTDDPGEIYAAWFFHHYRMPATWKLKFAEFLKRDFLWCTHEGERCRVVGCSRLGDIWLKGDGPPNAFYDKRVAVDDCSQWSRTENWEPGG